MMNSVGDFSCTFSIYDFHSRKPPDFPIPFPSPFAQELFLAPRATENSDALAGTLARHR